MQTKKIIFDGCETNYSIRDDGVVWNDVRDCEVTGTYERNEYHSVQLSINGKRKTFMTHRLVAEYFVPNPNPKLYTIVGLKDGNPQNRNASNLQWEMAVRQTKIARKDAKNKEITFEKKEISEFEWKDIEKLKGFKACREGYILSPKNKIVDSTRRNGYLRFCAHGHFYSVHRIIYETYIGPIEKGMDIDHIDGNRSNNNIANLRLVSHSENMKNAYRNIHNKATPVLQIDAETGEIVMEYTSQAEAARSIGSSPDKMYSAVKNKKELCGYFWEKKNF